jgi:enoyl-CoA hydratase/carnithine racemase
VSATEDARFDDIVLEVDDSVATLTLNRPEHRNAWTLSMDAEVGAALSACHADDNIRAVIVTGAGSYFCVGADLSGRDIAAPGGAGPAPPRAKMLPSEICKPVIAAINGHGVGIGVTFPMQCDIRIVSETAKLGLPFVRRGVISELNGHWLLPRLVGFAAAADLLLTGRLITGPEAVSIGLCSRAVPAEEVLPLARSLAREIATTTSPVAVAASKRLMWDALEMSRIQAATREAGLFGWLASLPDAREGVDSFLEHRDPVWTMPPSYPLPSRPSTAPPDRVHPNRTLPTLD